MQSTDFAEIENIISSLNINKASSQRNVSNNALNLFKKSISKPLTDLLNLSFCSDIFLLCLKFQRQYLFLKGL